MNITDMLIDKTVQNLQRPNIGPEIQEVLNEDKLLLETVFSSSQLMKLMNQSILDLQAINGNRLCLNPKQVSPQALIH